ncbi:MAG: hypothetical protein JF587_10175 [Catenulisporales bacterium]|jgi:hypothetical protein|nr:hypothetical protein [Catenulisporales bacterium]
MSAKNTTKTAAWLVPGILVAGALLLIGAIVDGNGTLIIVTFMLMALTIAAAGRSTEDRPRRRNRRDRHH